MAQWYWKRDLRLTEDKDEGWTPYTDEQSVKIEKGFQRGFKTMKLNDKYRINFTDLIQHQHVHSSARYYFSGI